MAPTMMTLMVPNDQPKRLDGRRGSDCAFVIAAAQVPEVEAWMREMEEKHGGERTEAALRANSLGRRGMRGIEALLAGRARSIYLNDVDGKYAFCFGQRGSARRCASGTRVAKRSTSWTTTPVARAKRFKRGYRHSSGRPLA